MLHNFRREFVMSRIKSPQKNQTNSFLNKFYILEYFSYGIMSTTAFTRRRLNTSIYNTSCRWITSEILQWSWEVLHFRLVISLAAQGAHIERTRWNFQPTSSVWPYLPYKFRLFNFYNNKVIGEWICIILLWIKKRQSYPYNRPSRLPHFLDNRLTDVGEVVSLTPRPPFTPRKIPGTHFC
jgi:hypothetical protein